MMAILISRKTGKPMGTIYPDGKTFYSKEGDISVESTVLVSSDSDGKYGLSRIEDDIAPWVSNMDYWIHELDLSGKEIHLIVDIKN